MRFAVVVNDPQQSRPYGFVIEHDDEREARIAAVRKAIVADPHGCGPGRADGVPLDDETRAAQAAADDIVGLMADAYTHAAELIE